jgi:hypothetical protein
VRQRASRLPLHRAVRLAAHAFFRFSHRSDSSKALWSRRERVWMGSQTYLYWAMSDPRINIPWLVADVPDAPDARDALQEAVRAELVAYWGERLAALPQKKTPSWPPLP